MTNAYYAEKTPHSTGTKSGIFYTVEGAHEWLQSVIADDPGVKRWEIQENSFTDPKYTYMVVEGDGKVAGSIYEAPVRADSDHSDEHVLDREHHNAPKDGNDGPVGITEGDE